MERHVSFSQSSQEMQQYLIKSGQMNSPVSSLLFSRRKTTEICKKANESSAEYIQSNEFQGKARTTETEAYLALSIHQALMGPCRSSGCHLTPTYPSFSLNQSRMGFSPSGYCYWAPVPLQNEIQMIAREWGNNSSDSRKRYGCDDLTQVGQWANIGWDCTRQAIVVQPQPICIAGKCKTEMELVQHRRAQRDKQRCNSAATLTQVCQKPNVGRYRACQGIDVKTQLI